jgi:hypothetical protein
MRRISGGPALTTLGESVGSVQFETVPAADVALVAEQAVNGGMDGGEFLETSHTPEPKHRPLYSSQR